MNHDRFLTRVFDIKRGMMIYPGDEIYCEVPLRTFLRPWDAKEFDGKAILCKYWGCTWNTEGEFFSLIVSSPTGGTILMDIDDGYLKERYVPMMCTGYKDDNKKLIYQEDIIEIEGVNFDGKLNYWVKFYEEEDCHIANFISPIDGEWDYILLHSLLEHAKKIKIIGNEWENEKVLEVKA